MTNTLDYTDGSALANSIVELAEDKKYADIATSTSSAETAEFFLEELKTRMETDNMQYTRLTGAPLLVEAVQKAFQPYFKPELNGMTNVMVGAGAKNCLQNCILGFCDKTDEVVTFEPFDESLLQQVKLSNTTLKTVPLIKPAFSDVAEGKEVVAAKWEIDFTALEQALSSKTKILLVSSVQQGTGKVFSQAEMDKIAEIAVKYPKLRVVQDCSDWLVASNNERGLAANTILGFERTLSVFSAGKLFNANGIKIGWVISSNDNLRPVCAFHQVNTFCLWEALQNAVGKSLLVAAEKGILDNKTDERIEENKKLVSYQLSKANAKFYVPEGGNYILVQVSNLTEFTANAIKNNILVFPCQFNFTDSTINYVRIAIHKDKDTLMKALSQLEF